MFGKQMFAMAFLMEKAISDHSSVPGTGTLQKFFEVVKRKVTPPSLLGPHCLHLEIHPYTVAYSGVAYSEVVYSALSQHLLVPNQMFSIWGLTSHKKK